MIWLVWCFTQNITDDKVKLITSDCLDLSQNDKIDFVEGEVFATINNTISYGSDRGSKKY